MARKIHSFSLGLSLKTCYEFLVLINALPYLQLHKDHTFFPLPLKICCGSAPYCEQYSVSLKSLPVQISSSRGRKTAVHTWIYCCSCSTVVLSIPPIQATCLLHLPSRFLQRKDAQTCKVALRQANSPLVLEQSKRSKPTASLWLCCYLHLFQWNDTYSRGTMNCKQAAC